MTARLVLVDSFLSLFTSLLLRTLRTERKTGLYILVLEQIVSLVAFALSGRVCVGSTGPGGHSYSVIIDAAVLKEQSVGRNQCGQVW